MKEENYLERILYGVAKAITEHINMGDSYSSVKKIYSISIIYFDLGKGEDYIYKGSSRFCPLLILSIHLLLLKLFQILPEVKPPSCMQ